MPPPVAMTVPGAVTARRTALSRLRKRPSLRGLRCQLRFYLWFHANGCRIHIVAAELPRQSAAKGRFACGRAPDEINRMAHQFILGKKCEPAWNIDERSLTCNRRGGIRGISFPGAGQGLGGERTLCKKACLWGNFVKNAGIGGDGGLYGLHLSLKHAKSGSSVVKDGPVPRYCGVAGL